MVLCSTQPLTVMSTRNVSRQPARKAGKLTAIMCSCHEIWEPQPPGTLRACPDQYRDWFTFTFTSNYFCLSAFFNF